MKNNSEDCKFILDQMLGRLAKWLRLLGYDSLYFKNIDDKKLISISKSENRILLTRDTGIIKRKEVRKAIINAVLINSDNLNDQIKQLHQILKIKLRQKPFCAVCNEPIEEIEKENVKLLVPPYVFKTQHNFFRCPECNRIFWDGTHWKYIKTKARGYGLLTITNFF
ncbi:MAG: Mut7-C RNAse domain-containing protein [Actinobacteria bacterium]|nr:Mut7-C RNAse domain-containing protein [Actinomycetota bacterium]